MKNVLVQNAGQIVTAMEQPLRGRAMRELSIQRDTSIYLEDGQIIAIGPLNTIEKEITDNPEIINAQGKTVIPGFIDSHTHLVFAGTRDDEFALKIQGASYQEIAQKGGGILSTVEKTREASKEQLVDIGLKYLQKALQLGTTTMEVKTGYGLDLQNELKILNVIAELNMLQPIELLPTFIGAHAVPPGKTSQQYTDEVIAMIPQVTDKVIFCDVFCEKDYFGIEETRAILLEAKRHGLHIRLHADQLTNNGGVKLALEMDALSVDHLEKISDEEIHSLAKSNTCATLLPGVSLFLNYDYPPARKIIDSGCIVALATDFNPGSCMCLNMQLILSLACMQMRMLPEEVITAATVNAAYCLNMQNIGRIAPGQQADLLILDVPNYRMIPYFLGQNHVNIVIKRGEIVFC